MRPHCVQQPPPRRDCANRGRLLLSEDIAQARSVLARSGDGHGDARVTNLRAYDGRTHSESEQRTQCYASNLNKEIPISEEIGSCNHDIKNVKSSPHIVKICMAKSMLK
jgi:hypothetical protein